MKSFPVPAHRLFVALATAGMVAVPMAAGTVWATTAPAPAVLTLHRLPAAPPPQDAPDAEASPSSSLTASAEPTSPAPSVTSASSSPSAPASTQPTSSSAPRPTASPTRAAPTHAAPSSTPTTRPRPTPSRTSAPKPVSSGTVRHYTPWTALNAAIGRIPGYGSRPGVRWVISSRFGHYGMTDWYHDTIYLSPSVPASRLDAVARHEYGHILEARAYGGNIPRMIAGLSTVFGAGGRGNLMGTERAADCIAILTGATWTNYTSCSNAAWRAAARRIIDGLPV